MVLVVNFTRSIKNVHVKRNRLLRLTSHGKLEVTHKEENRKNFSKDDSAQIYTIFWPLRKYQKQIKKELF